MPSTMPRRHPHLPLLTALVALSAAACTGPTPSESEAIAPRAEAPPPAPMEEPPEYLVLADASVFEGHAVDEAGVTPLSAIAFARLVLRDDAGALFDLLL